MKKLALLALVAVAGASQAALLYTNTTQTGFRYNPGVGNIAFDDILVPDAIRGGNGFIDLTSVTVGIRRLGGSGAFDATLWIGEFDDAGFLTSAVSLGTASFGANAGSSVTSLLTASGTLGNVALNTNLVAGYGAFALGLQLSTADAGIGWRLTNGPDANLDYFVQVDTVNNTQSGVWFGGPPNPAGTFYAVVEGTPTPVPEPATMAVLGAGALALLRRRRK